MISAWKRLGGVWKALLMGFALQFGGYLLVRGDQTEYGYVMFLLVPFVSGFVVGANVREHKRAGACLAVCGLLTCSILLFTGLEGSVCIVMALPLLLACTAFGSYVGYILYGMLKDHNDQNNLTMLICFLSPLLIAASDGVEKHLTSTALHQTFTTEITVNGSPQEVWDKVARMKKLDGPRPFLLRVGLPVPYSCTLDRESVGGHRTCYFNNGRIDQIVTDWKKPFHMGLNITRSTLPGRHWLKFVDASYNLYPVGNKTRIVRHSTISTRLSPRWYWRPLERWGVVSEHAYVFSNLEKWTRRGAG